MKRSLLALTTIIFLSLSLVAASSCGSSTPASNGAPVPQISTGFLADPQKVPSSTTDLMVGKYVNSAGEYILIRKDMTFYYHGTFEAYQQKYTDFSGTWAALPLEETFRLNNLSGEVFSPSSASTIIITPSSKKFLKQYYWKPGRLIDADSWPMPDYHMGSNNTYVSDPVLNGYYVWNKQ